MKNKMIKRFSIKRIAKFVCVMVLAMTMLSGSMAMSSCSMNGRNTDESYVKIESNGKKLSVCIPIEKKDPGQVYLFGVELWQGIDSADSSTLITEAKVSGKEAKAEFDITGQLTETLCKGYFFAEEISSGVYSALTGIYYVSNPREAMGKQKTDEDELSVLLKGAQGSAVRLSEMNAGATVLTVELSDLMCGADEIGALPYVWNGLTYYADEIEMNRLDKKISAYNKSGVKVYLELVQSKPASALPADIAEMTFNAASGKSGYALNMTTREGASRVCGIFDFLAERYGKSGMSDSFIIGRNVNLISDHYAGGPDHEEGIENYLNAVRAAYNILLSYAPRGNVYIGLSNNWSMANSGDYSVRDMLSVFNNLAGASGDFFWQVSVEANASDASDSSIWSDPLAIEKTEFISPANIELLSNQLAANMYSCRGMQRHILLNRFSIGGSNEAEQAASYVYAYYKSLNARSVDAIIYETVDDRDELKNGIYALDATGAPTAKKLTEMFLNIDGEDGVDLDFMSGTVGSNWKHLYKENRKEAVRISAVTGQAYYEGEREEIVSVANMSVGESFGFAPLAEGTYSEFRYSHALARPTFYTGAFGDGALDAIGTVSNEISAEALGEGDLLEITAMMSAATGKGKMTLKLSGYDRKGVEHIYTSEAEMTANEWNNYYFDISDFIKEVDESTVSMTITVRSDETGAKTSGLWISEINSVSDSAVSLTWIFIVIGILAAVGGITVFVLWFKKNYVFVKE